MTQRRDERRRSTRVPARITLELRTVGDDRAARPLVGQSVNLSSGGICWTSPEFIPPLSRLSLALLVPNGGRPRYDRVDLDGVVVRTLPAAPDPPRDRYEVACVFTRLSEGGRDRLDEFVARRETGEGARPASPGEG